MGLGCKIGTFFALWSQTLVPFGTQSRIRDLIGAPECRGKLRQLQTHYPLGIPQPFVQLMGYSWPSASVRTRQARIRWGPSARVGHVVDVSINYFLESSCPFPGECLPSIPSSFPILLQHRYHELGIQN